MVPAQKHVHSAKGRRKRDLLVLDGQPLHGSLGLGLLSKDVLALGHLLIKVNAHLTVLLLPGLVARAAPGHCGFGVFGLGSWGCHDGGARVASRPSEVAPYRRSRSYFSVQSAWYRTILSRPVVDSRVRRTGWKFDGGCLCWVKKKATSLALPRRSVIFWIASRYQIGRRCCMSRTAQ